jgi:hypothetical protein
VINGSFTQATGTLTLEGEAGGVLASKGKECSVSTEPSTLALSTSGTSGGASSRSGARFTSGLTGHGAIAGQWTDMHASPINDETSFCENVEDEIGGAGGVWLEQKGDQEAPAPPLLTSTNPPSPAYSGTPQIRGSAEAGSTVRLFSGTDCAGSPVASGSAEELNSPGITVQVPQGTVAQFFATATDAAANVSACSDLL